MTHEKNWVNVVFFFRLKKILHAFDPQGHAIAKIRNDTKMQMKVQKKTLLQKKGADEKLQRRGLKSAVSKSLHAKRGLFFNFKEFLHFFWSREILEFSRDRGLVIHWVSCSKRHHQACGSGDLLLLPAALSVKAKVKATERGGAVPYLFGVCQ